MRSKVSMILAVILFTGISASGQEYKAVPEKSELKWTGKKVTGEHYGTIDLKKGSITLKDNAIVSGKFEIDMSTITNEDLTSEEYNQKLVGHLHSDDFFSTEKYPVSTLKITNGSKFKKGVSSVTGDLTIKGITKPVSFEVTRNGSEYSATITVDRTLYNIRYGSGKFFDNLGDKMIHDDFVLNVKLVVE